MLGMPPDCINSRAIFEYGRIAGGAHAGVSCRIAIPTDEAITVFAARANMELIYTEAAFKSVRKVNKIFLAPKEELPALGRGNND
jgi:hypothetical protein